MTTVYPIPRCVEGAAQNAPITSQSPTTGVAPPGDAVTGMYTGQDPVLSSSPRILVGGEGHHPASDIMQGDVERSDVPFPNPYN